MEKVRARVCVFVILIFFMLTLVRSEGDAVKLSLVQFMEKLSPVNDEGRDGNWGWNMTSDPCTHSWKGISCDSYSQTVQKIALDELNLTGIFDSSSVCNAKSLQVLSLNNNRIRGEISEEIENCQHLTHLYVSGNSLAGTLPKSMSHINSLKRVDFSDNNFTGQLPSLHKIPGLLSFLAQNNHLSGRLPEFKFDKMEEFNVSNNNLSGQIPEVGGRFNADSFTGNPGLCGKPLQNVCPVSQTSKVASKSWSTDRFLIYLGYAFLALIITLITAYGIVCKIRRKHNKANDIKKGVGVDENSFKAAAASHDESETGEFKSEYSMTSMESGVAPSTLVVLSKSFVEDLKFDDLLQSPAELLGRGRYGTLYKVRLDDGATLAVKRIKDKGIPREEFVKRMLKMDQLKHPNILPVIAFYCSNQEKLLLYEHQPNGSLFKLLHGSKHDQSLDWGVRLDIAAKIAGALAFMHKELHEDRIAHGNLKSTNILFDKRMDPYISEYGIMEVQHHHQDQLDSRLTMSVARNNLPQDHARSIFAGDTYSLGLILLELLTGKMVQDGGFGLAAWVHSVVREEWTSEVFDRTLIMEGICEERLVNFLHVALKCVAPSPADRPIVREVSAMINSIKEDEERSISSESLSFML